MSSATPDSEPAPSAAEPQIVFRAAKRKKFHRARPEDTDTATAPVDATPAPPSDNTIRPEGHEDDQNGGGDDDEESGLSVAEVLRLRNARKHRLAGVGFRPETVASGSNSENAEQSLVLHEDEQKTADAVIAGGIPKRFAPQTGLVGELVNKHMEEYVESELARRKRQAYEAQQQQQQQQQQDRDDGGDDNGGGAPQVPAKGGFAKASAVALRQDPQRVLQGKLMEIDLGEEVRSRNVQMTERAKRRLKGIGGGQGQATEEAAADLDEDDGQPKKVRLGPDGTPWRPRNRRGSDDTRRDQLVEEFLSENKLDVYDLADDSNANAAASDEEEGAADARIAEQFRREFMDAMAARSRRRRRAAVPTRNAPARNPDEYLKGPKLGGSRNERAAMRELLLKEQVSKRR